jgi:hypothetical protein
MYIFICIYSNLLLHAYRDPGLDQLSDSAVAFKIGVMPTYIFFSNGSELNRVEGPDLSAVSQMIEESVVCEPQLVVSAGIEAGNGVVAGIAEKAVFGNGDHRRDAQMAESCVECEESGLPAVETMEKQEAGDIDVEEVEIPLELYGQKRPYFVREALWKLHTYYNTTGPQQRGPVCGGNQVNGWVPFKSAVRPAGHDSLAGGQPPVDTTTDATSATAMSMKDRGVFLTHWIRQEFTYPYPDKDYLCEMAKVCGTTADVIDNWLINNRVRRWRPALAKAAALGRPADNLLEDAIAIFDGKVVRPQKEEKPVVLLASTKRKRSHSW